MPALSSIDRNPTVFISYSHDSEEHVVNAVALADKLRVEGIDCNIDEYEDSPAEGWNRWMIAQIKQADFVLVVCTEVYNRRFEAKEEPGRGLGATWEGNIITQELYETQSYNSKYIPVIFHTHAVEHIPDVLKSTTHYDLGHTDGYETLYRRLTAQPRTEKPALGDIKPMPPRKRKHDFPKPAQAQNSPGSDRAPVVIEQPPEEAQPQPCEQVTSSPKREDSSWLRLILEAVSERPSLNEICIPVVTLQAIRAALPAMLNGPLLSSHIAITGMTQVITCLQAVDLVREISSERYDLNESGHKVVEELALMERPNRLMQHLIRHGALRAVLRSLLERGTLTRGEVYARPVISSSKALWLWLEELSTVTSVIQLNDDTITFRGPQTG